MERSLFQTGILGIEIAESTEQGMEEILRMQKSEANQGLLVLSRQLQQTGLMIKAPINLCFHPTYSVIKFFLSLMPEIKLYLFLSIISGLINGEFCTAKWATILQLKGWIVLRNSAFCNTICQEFIVRRNYANGDRRIFPDLWINDEEDETKNQYEEELLRKQMQRQGYGGRLYYEKINNQRAGKSWSKTTRTFFRMIFLSLFQFSLM